MENQYKKPLNIGRFFVGLAIVLIGLVLLAQNSGWIDMRGLNINFADLWPVIIILIGLSMLSSGSVLGTIIGILFAVIVFAITAILFFFPNMKNENASILIANPASVYCESQGGTTDIRTNQDGSQTGYCVFQDKSECDEWTFLLKKCSPGQNFQ